MGDAHIHFVTRCAIVAAALAAVLAETAGASAVDPVMFVDGRGQIATLVFSRSPGHVMMQRTDVSLTDVAYIPETVLPTVRVEEVGGSGLAGLLFILTQDGESEDSGARSPRDALADEWIRAKYTKNVPDGLEGDVGVHEKRSEFASADGGFPAAGVVRRWDDRRATADAGLADPGRPLAGPAPVYRASAMWHGAVRSGFVAPAKSRAAARTPKSPALPGVVRSEPEEEDDLHAIFFEGSSGNLSAEVWFWQEGSKLMIQLTNTSMVDPTTTTNVLTALFFNVAGQPTLTPVSAVLASDSVLLYVTKQPSDGVTVGGEWAYRAGDVKSPGSMEYGLSATGYNAIFKPADRFPGESLATNGNSMTDASFGLVGPGKVLVGKDKKMYESTPFIMTSVIFTLDGLPETFDLLVDIDHVWFQYGTSLNDPSIESFRIIQEWEEEIINPPDPPEPPGPPDPPTPPDVPEPMTLGMLLLGTAALLCRR